MIDLSHLDGWTAQNMRYERCFRRAPYVIAIAPNAHSLARASAQIELDLPVGDYSLAVRIESPFPQSGVANVEIFVLVCDAQALSESRQLNAGESQEVRLNFSANGSSVKILFTSELAAGGNTAYSWTAFTMPSITSNGEEADFSLIGRYHPERPLELRVDNSDYSLRESFIAPITTLPSGIDGNRTLRDAFFELVSVLRPTIFCDIGANDGSTAQAARTLVPACTIFAFEANPRIFAMHAAVNAARNVDFLNLAITDKRGRVTVFAPKTLSRANVDGKLILTDIIESENTRKTSLLLRNEEATYERFEVEGRSLDDFFYEHGVRTNTRCAFLWIDVEGAAMRVLNGADAVLGATQVIFIETESFEFWKGQEGCVRIIEHLYKRGFRPVARDREYGDKQFNIIFVHDDLLSDLEKADLQDHSALRKIFPRTIYATVSQIGSDSREGNRRAYSSVVSWLQSTIPVLVPCFNNPTYVRSMLRQLRNVGFADIILVDNASTSPEMRDWIETLQDETKIICLDRNFGPKHIVQNECNFALLPQRFCITDPDLVFNKLLPPDFMGQLAALVNRHKVGKAGFALHIFDRWMMVDRKFRMGDVDLHIWDWERQFWEKPLGELESGDRFYDAKIDTTFALYDKTYFDRSAPLKAIRVAGRYTARHLPWYRESGMPEAEASLYRKTQQFSYYFPEDTP